MKPQHIKLTKTFFYLYSNGTESQKINLRHMIHEALKKRAKKYNLKYESYDPISSTLALDFTLSGFPESQRGRDVLIYHEKELIHSRAKANASDLPWKAVFTSNSNSQQWVDPLMGWKSTSDPMEGFQVSADFKTLEDAITWANRNGFRTNVAYDQKFKKDHKSYADKFVHTPEESEW